MQRALSPDEPKVLVRKWRRGVTAFRGLELRCGAIFVVLAVAYTREASFYVTYIYVLRHLVGPIRLLEGD